MHVRGSDQSIMRHNGSWLATWRSHDAHGQLMPVALGSNVLTGEAISKGASRSCQRCWKALLYLSDTAPLGQAHGHRKLAVGEWRGDGPFRYELPNKIPVLEANSSSQRDEVGG